MRKGSFKGDPNGFVALPKGSLFRRRYYEYKVMVQGQQWKKYEGVYYEPNPREYENDYNEILWIKTTDASDRFGWMKLYVTPPQEDVYVLLVEDNDYTFLSEIPGEDSAPPYIFI